MREKKWDISKIEFIESEGSGNKYAFQVLYNDGENSPLPMEEKGYYVVVSALFEDTTGELYLNKLYTNTKLLVSCSRRGEKPFNKALEEASKKIYGLVDSLETERMPLDNMGLNDDFIKDLAKETKEKVEGKLKNNKHNNNSCSSTKTTISKDKEKKRLTFDDIAGMHDVKEILYDVIDQFNNPQKYKHFGIKPIRAVLLYGSPGTGKTFIANAFANEIDANFKNINIGDIGSKYQNATSNNIKKIFDNARKSSKTTVLFFDEVDSIASKRGTDENSKEKNNTLNTLLQEMSSDNNENIFIICATNFYETLDNAFTRRGRIDASIEIPLPDFETRKEILNSSTKNKPLAQDVELDKISKNLSGFNCADVDVLVNESARLALKRNKDTIEQIDFEDAFEEMIAGKSSQTRKLDEKTKKIVATHEVGHLLANELLEVNKTKKLSILPRGSALGYLLHVNEEKNDVFLYNKEELENRVKVMLAGRVNEELFFGRATTGASDDLKKANALVRQMITKYGYSEELGLLVVNNDDTSLSTNLNELIRIWLDRIYAETKILLEGNKDLAKLIIDILCEKEELDGNEISEIINKFQKEVKQIVYLGQMEV